VCIAPHSPTKPHKPEQAAALEQAQKRFQILSPKEHTGFEARVRALQGDEGVGGCSKDFHRVETKQLQGDEGGSMVQLGFPNG
jgi:hypothetical protein